MRGNKQQNIEITRVKVKQKVRKLVNWNAPGSDGVRGYWINKFVY